MSVWVEHEVGPLEEGVQRCIRCGRIVTDRRGAYELGPTGPRAVDPDVGGWEPGAVYELNRGGARSGWVKSRPDAPIRVCEPASSPFSPADLEGVRCAHCGGTPAEPVEQLGCWRWAGEHWQHACPRLDPQVGHLEVRRPAPAAGPAPCVNCQGAGRWNDRGLVRRCPCAQIPAIRAQQLASAAQMGVVPDEASLLADMRAWIGSRWPDG